MDTEIIYVVTWYGCNSTPSDMYMPINTLFRNYEEAYTYFLHIVKKTLVTILLLNLDIKSLVIILVKVIVQRDHMVQLLLEELLKSKRLIV